MTIDTKRIFEKLNCETHRGSLTMYLDKQLWRRFKEFCHKQEVSAARVIEEFMRETLRENSAKKTKQSP